MNPATPCSRLGSFRQILDQHVLFGGEAAPTIRRGIAMVARQYRLVGSTVHWILPTLRGAHATDPRRAPGTVAAPAGFVAQFGPDGNFVELGELCDDL